MVDNYVYMPNPLQTLVTGIKDDCKNKGLQLNAKKIKVLVFKGEVTRIDVRVVDDVVLDQVESLLILDALLA